VSDGAAGISRELITTRGIVRASSSAVNMTRAVTRRDRRGDAAHDLAGAAGARRRVVIARRNRARPPLTARLLQAHAHR
jgi:hypothetical protein